MSNDFFNASGAPAQGGQLVSPNMRAEFAAVAAGFDKLPALTGNAYKITYVNASGAAMDVVGGDGLLKLSTAGIPSVAVAGTDYLSPAAIGTTVQAHSANLDEFAAVNPTAAGLALLDDADAAAQRATLGSTVVGDAVFVAASQAAAQAALGITASGGSEESLTGFYHPAVGSAYQDCYRAGFLPSWFNQQWGGAQWGMLPDGSFGSVATGNVQDDNIGAFSYDATTHALSSAFILSEGMTSPTIWVKAYKNGNPTGNLQVAVYSSTTQVASTAKPNAIVGSQAIKTGQEITSKTDGEWYSFTPASGALTANTIYHIVLTGSASSTTNYFTVKQTFQKSKYPAGGVCGGTNAFVWTLTATSALCFLIQNPAANSLIQSGGMFDYKLSFAAGSPVNQSRSVAQPLANFYDGKSCSVLYRGTFAVSSNVWDFCYGLDHDRITLTINASGYPVLSVYRNDGALVQVTGTGSVTSGNHDVGIRVRTVGDGADYATLYVDGVSVGTPLTAQTFTMAAEMARLGTARLGDGFGLAPTWTQDMQMTSLPSAQGWTWTGTATQANAMSIQNNKLYQNATGYTSTQTGYYQKTVVMVNATGWTATAKVRTPANTNKSLGNGTVAFVIKDGTSQCYLMIQEYFIQDVYSGVTAQFDFKSQEVVLTVCGKGTDYYVFANGKLLIDGTGKLTTSSGGLNTISIGDFDTTASENADAIWSYVKYYQGGMILPTAATATCSEFAHWSGDKSALYATLWNSGTPVSVKETCGVPRNYQFEQMVQREVRRGVTANPTTTSTSVLGVEPDLECYVIGSLIKTASTDTLLNTTAGSSSVTAASVDGVDDPLHVYAGSSINYPSVVSTNMSRITTLGLHKVEQKWRCGANTTTTNGTTRNLQVEALS